jgi:hypothetical protein
LEVICTATGSRKKTALKRFALADFEWGTEQDAAFMGCKEALRKIVTLAHPDPDKVFCLYTDASQDFWGATLTQIPAAEADLPLGEQQHSPLAFLSGALKGASLRWSTAEKEAYAIVASCKRLDYLLHRPGGFVIHTDHRNLAFIFSNEPDTNQPRYLADKLARWAVALSSFRYTIKHVAGDDNVWGDLLSRWGHQRVAEAAVWEPELDDEVVRGCHRCGAWPPSPLSDRHHSTSLSNGLQWTPSEAHKERRPVSSGPSENTWCWVKTRSPGSMG